MHRNSDEAGRTRRRRSAIMPALLAALIGSVSSASVGAQDAFADTATLEPAGSALSTPDDDGFIRRWLVLEPIPVAGRLNDNAVRETVGADYFPDQLAVLPADGDRVTVGGETLGWHAVDTTHYNLNLFHFARALGKPTSNVLFWAVTIVDSPAEQRDVRLAIGSNAASVWWVNGREVIAIYDDRQTVIDDGVSRRITLKKGRNVIRAAIINAGGATDFCARLLDALDDPITALTVRLD
jgi:hypothetical protein